MSTVSTPSLAVRPAAECRYDVLALGEVMPRLDPGDRRIRATRTFDVWEGGGEYNVARGLRRAFGMRAAVVTALADDVGCLVEDFILTGRVDTSHIQWVAYGGIGRTVRNGPELHRARLRGAGRRRLLRPREHRDLPARPGGVDWDAICSQGVRWFHTGSVFAGLSETTALVAQEAMAAARRHGTVVSDDLNLRLSIWAATGGLERAIEVNREFAASADVMIRFLSLVRPPTSAPPPLSPSRRCGTWPSRLPRTSRGSRSSRRRCGTCTPPPATTGALAWSRTEGFAQSVHRSGLKVFDRVGGGD